jgi:hypothetical protein
MAAQELEGPPALLSACLSQTKISEGPMARSWILTLLAGMTLASSAPAQQTGWRFRWQPGQVLHYRVENHTTDSETVSGNKVDMVSEQVLLKRWEVMGVDAGGVATVKLSVTAMFVKQNRPNGEVVVFDSSNPDKSTPELRTQMSKFVGQTLAVLRVDGFGKVVEVQQGDAKKFESNPPFTLRLPPQAVAAGQAWDRLYDITLDPPHGTGEKYQAKQRFQLMSANNAVAALKLTTTMVTQPDAAADRIPLLRHQPDGDIVFNVAAGRIESVNLRIDKAIQNHQGEGSSYRFISTYKEQFVPTK